MLLDSGSCLLVGMVHLQPLPGSPGFGGDVRAIIDAAHRDASRLIEGGCDAVLVENMGDLPYLKGRVDAETIAAAALATARVIELGVPTGVQLLAGANRDALGLAVATGATFVRVEAFAYAHVADEGLMDACAGELLRARRALGCAVSIWADVQKKHAAHAITADLPLVELARGTAFCGADALIVTGIATGSPTDPADVDAARAAGLPVIVGSGVTEHNATALARRAAALIVGTALKQDEDWRKPVDVARVRRVRQALEAAR